MDHVLRPSTPGGRQPRRRRRGGNRGASASCIDCLGEDILFEIFRRLPSLATLIRAALSCRAWRSAVASSPSFRRRFRALHPAPALGLFFSPFSPVQYPNAPAFPAFVPTRRPDLDLAAAVRGGDFFLTSVQHVHGPGMPPCWDVFDCRDGFLMLNDWDECLLLLFNPLSRSNRGSFLSSEDILDDCRGCGVLVDPQFIYSEEDPSSFRVVWLAHDESRVRAAVFSSDTWEWRNLPWFQANGMFIYWVCNNRESIITLDTTTMDFSLSDLPHYLRSRDVSFVIGETKDGAPCIVYAFELFVGVFLRTTDDTGVERWELGRVVDLGTRIQHVLGDLPDDLDDMNVVAIRNGFVYLATSKMHHDPQNPCWFLSLCLETMELEMLFQRTFDGDVCPYVLSWPRSLVGNYGKFALEVAP
ncbi:uncharacterized protein LOC124663552 [Lolium rigidum]|uniref:uncharacterized protein LOC124663552 n=1 Tax=Lolium rigidum TaxID=89674 RepID=UPI001F5D6BF6|nr:uncharacterized protein LOC124663552 [Lolium rigidum]